RQLQVDRVFGEADRLEPPRRVAAHLGSGDARIGEPRNLERDDPLGIGAGPYLVVPVVPGPDTGQSQFLVLAPGELGACEPGYQGREAQGRPDTGEVHVDDAGMDVPAA